MLVRAEGRGQRAEGRGQSNCTADGVSDVRVTFGKHGEDVACDELQRRGYVILDRRFRTRCGELDIVARHGIVIVFVEVKARTDGNFGEPLESITWQKRRRMARMAAAYLLQKKLGDVPCRFDVVAVVEGPGAGPTVELIQGAFEIGT
jgi:putative endonuclease